MPTEFPGDATEEDIKNQLHRELRGQLTGVTGSKQVTVDAATAALLLELIPEPPPEEEAEPKKMASAAAPAASKAKQSREQLEAMTKEQLIEQADDEDIEVSQSWTKAQIIDALQGG